MSQDDKPTAKQQRYLRTLAQNTATSFTPPATRYEASKEIDRLRGLKRSPGHERSADRQAVAAAPRGGQTRVRETEIEGYGSTATWNHGAPR